MIKMAFRNIFRNPKRTFLTAFVVLIGIMGIIMGLSFITGVENLFVKEGINLTGEIRITSKDFEIKERKMDLTANIDYKKIKEKTKKYSEIKKGIGRIKFGAVIYSEDEYEKALGFGIEEDDYKYSGLQKSIYEGEFFNYKKVDEILIGNKIKEKLNLKLGDEVTILTSTQHKSISALNYKIIGFYKMENSRLNRSFYIKLNEAQYLLDMENKITEYLIFCNKTKNINEIGAKIKKEFKKGYLVKLWSEIGFNGYLSRVFPVIKRIFMIILGFLSGVGIGNTMMMIVFERRKEIGVLKASGMMNFNITKLFCLEGVIIGLMGSISGAFLGGVWSLYLSKKGLIVGDVLENISNEINIPSIIYPDYDISRIIIIVMLGLLVSFLATLLSVVPEVKKNPVINMRNE